MEIFPNFFFAKCTFFIWFCKSIIQEIWSFWSNKIILKNI